MAEVNVISPQAELLLTSSGITTLPMRERLLEMGHLAGDHQLRVLRLADSWQPFQRNDTVTRGDRFEQAAEHFGDWMWSNRFLKWVLGKRAIIETAVFRPNKTTRLGLTYGQLIY